MFGSLSVLKQPTLKNACVLEFFLLYLYPRLRRPSREMSTENNTEWVHCNQCLRQTRHDIIAVRVVNATEYIDEDGYPARWQTTNTVFECRGCGSVSLRRQLAIDGLEDDIIEYYPPPVSRQSPTWRYDLPNEITSLLEKVYTALHANSRRLALMGLRAIVDLFINATIGDIGSFKVKLDKLVDDHHLSRENRETLEVALDAGHAATHRAYNPSPYDLASVLDIMENLIRPLALKKRIEELKKNIPKRKVQQGD